MTLAAWLAGPPRQSQRKLAHAAGCNQSMISMLAHGKRAARGKLALRLHRLTGVPVESLIATPQADADDN
jgi:transcriptional regulator with XRE-family HTH domain